MRLVIDTENTGSQRNKAHPFDYRNKCCAIGIKDVDTKQKWIYDIEHGEEPYGEKLQEIKSLVEKASMVVLFNGKYDLHWLRRYGIVLGDACRVFDCQLGYFILTSQRHKYPSLNDVAVWCGASPKLDVVKEEYWDKGFDTDEVPWLVLAEYLEQDLDTTEEVYFSLTEKIRESSVRTVVSVANQDLKVLEEMEWNGSKYLLEESVIRGDNIQVQIDEIDGRLRRMFSAPWANINSGDHLSVLLYGGTILLDGTEDYEFVYKDGRTAIKTRKVKIPTSSQGIFKPLEKTALAKEGFYSTSVDILKKLQEGARNEARKVIDLLLLRSRIEQRRGTYYHGTPKLASKMNWEDGILHGNLNQCVAITGRLSADKPNLQNVEEEVKELFVSRFPIRRIG